MANTHTHTHTLIHSPNTHRVHINHTFI